MGRSVDLTVKKIESLAPRSDRYEVKDGAEQGLWLVVFPSGKKSFVFRYRFDKLARKLTIGPVTLADARRAAREARNLVEDGIDPCVRKQGTKLAKSEEAKKEREAIEQASTKARDRVEAVVDQFVERHCSNLRTGAAVARVLRREVAGPWKGRRLSEITRADVHDLLDAMADRGSPIQANRLYAYLSKMCGWAISRDLIEKSPVEGVPKPAQENSRDRALDDREIALVWRAAEQVGWPFGDIARLLLLTGQRKSEIADLAWSEVDLDAKLLRLPAERVKNKRAHDVPLCPQAISILDGLPRIDSKRGYVFSTTGKTSVSGFSRAKRQLDDAICEMSGGPISAWTFHDLRRSVATGLARIGVDLVVIERCLNHASGSFAGIVQVYQRHKYESEMRASLDAWGAHVEGVVASISRDRPR